MKNRSLLREIIIKILYQVYLYQKNDIDYNLNDVINENIESENDFVLSCVNGILSNEENISTLANKYLKDWSIDRLSLVDKAILSLGIYELMYTDTPSIVSINEAVELSKKYSDDSVIKMINACLDKIYHNEKNML